MLTLLLIFALVASGFVWVARNADPDHQLDDDAWAAAEAEQSGSVSGALLRAARPLARVPVIHNPEISPLYRAVERRLQAAGNPFGGAPEVFLAVQTFSVFVAMTMFAVAFVVPVPGPAKLAFVLIGAGLAGRPWADLQKKTKGCQDAVYAELPDFAELLQMPLAAGLGVVPAMRFTVAGREGPVADTVRGLLVNLDGNAMDNQMAYLIAGQQLGSPEAQAFFSSLADAHLRGSRVAESLLTQADALRKANYQRLRTDIKKIPTKIVLALFIHMFPLVFIVIGLPVMAAMTGQAL